MVVTVITAAVLAFTPHPVGRTRLPLVRCYRCFTSALASRERMQLSRDELKAIDGEMASIAVPALAGLAIDPLASLVDTAMVGRYCTAADLAGAGVAISVFGLVSKTFNFLSSATTSQVAALAPTDSEAGVFDLEMSHAAAAALAPSRRS